MMTVAFSESSRVLVKSLALMRYSYREVVTIVCRNPHGTWGNVMSYPTMDVIYYCVLTEPCATKVMKDKNRYIGNDFHLEKQ